MSTLSLSKHSRATASYVEKSTVRHYDLLLVLVFSHLTVLAILWWCGDGWSPALSLTCVSLASFAGVLVLYQFYLRQVLGTSILSVILCAFVLRLGIGIVHYLLIMQPSYFDGASTYSYLWDYEWMHQSLAFVRKIWLTSGFLSPLPISYWNENKNAYLFVYTALLYYLSGVHALNISPWNTLHSTYTASIIAAIALQLGANRQQATFAFGLAAFQPFGFISSIMWRDTIGQSFIALAIYMLIFYQQRLWLWLLIVPLASWLAYMQRQPYIILILSVAAYIFYINKLANANSVKKIFIIICGLPLLLLFFNTFDILNLALGRFSNSSFLTISLRLPFQAIKSIIGPFPWYQIFIVPHAQYMPADFLQHVMNLTVYTSLWLLITKKQVRGYIDASTLLGVLILLTAILASQQNSSYASIGTIFFLPFVCLTEPKQWWKIFYYVLTIYIVANLVYMMLGLTNSGILGL